MACVSYIESMFDIVVPPEDVGAFIMEPIGGSGGYQVPPPEYIPMVKKLCEKHGIKFISDEIQSGFGRNREDVRNRALRGGAGHGYSRKASRRGAPHRCRPCKQGDHGRLGGRLVGFDLWWERALGCCRARRH